MQMWQRRTFVIIGAVGVGLLAIGFFAVRANRAPARAVTVSAVTSTITIDPQVGETFAPAPPDAAPALTAEQAYAQYAQLSGYSDTTVPSDVTVQLGLLTLPVGPVSPDTGNLTTQNGIAYTALNELVYGYSWHSCPHSRNPNVATLPANPCIQWNFLNANSGKQVDDTWQQ